MAGVPELNGVFGTFSGMGGLDLTPIQMKQRSRMFQQQLAQEAAQMAQQEALATRELDLRQRGQDIGVNENDLARKFTENLQRMRQDFDKGQQEAAQQHAVAAQQRQIQEAQRAQGSAQEFQGQQAGLQRGLVREENAADRAQRAAAMEFDRERFEKTFGMEMEKFNFQKDVTLKDQDRADRAEVLKQQMFDLQRQEFQSQSEQRAASVKLVEMQTELYAQQLADAREEVNIDDADLEQIVEAASNGDVGSLGGALLKKVMGNKKSRDAVFGLIDLVKSAQEVGLVEEARAQQKAAPEEKAAPADTPEVAELRRKQEEGSLGSAGEARIGVFDKLAEISEDDSEPANKRREELNLILDLLKQYPDTEDIPGDLSVSKSDWLALIPPAFGIKRGAQVVNRIFKEFGVGEGANLRELLDKYDIEP